MEQEKGLLEPCRVLDLTDEKGILCGKFLGELGADVIKIEKPGGDPARSVGPFLKGEVDPEKSLFWLAYSANKRSITLNLETEDGRLLFERLVKTADIVVESFEPGYMSMLGLGYQDLCAIKPDIIMVSISPYGQTGPYAHYKGSDITVSAASGYMYLCGDPARPPLRFSYPLAYQWGAAAGLTGAVMALYWKRTSGEGQYVDASAQEALQGATEMAPINWDMDHVLMRRRGNRYGATPETSREINYRCADGWITMMIRTGRGAAESMGNLIKWMEEEGAASDFIKGIDWTQFGVTDATAENVAARDRVFKEIEQFFMRFPMQSLYAQIIKRNIIACPVFTVKDVAEDAQLKARDYWTEIEYPHLHTKLTYPAFFYKSSKQLRIRFRAPRIGEHNREIYIKELGLSSKELALLKRNGIV